MKNFLLSTIAAIFAFIVSGLSTGAPAHGQTYLNGIDVSYWQGSINWTSVANSGTTFAFMKATEGNSYVDSTFATNIRNATAAGVLVGPYHYCDLDTDTSNPLDPVNEANHFLNVIKPYYNSGLYLPPVADVEGFPSFGSTAEAKAFTSTWVQAFSNTIFNGLGVRPLIYTSLSKANSYYTSSVASQHELWLAWWKSNGTADPPTAADTPLWGPWQFWQWTSTGNVSGITGNVDRDLFNGTLRQLQALRIGNGAAPGSHITTISDFNTDEGYFGTSPTYSGSNRNITSVTADQVTTQAYEGAGSERLAVNGSNWTLRFLSGIGSPPADPSTNLGLPATGNIGFWLKTTNTGITTQILIDDATDNSVIEGGTAKNVIADGQWHLYQWNLQDAAQWSSFFQGDGQISIPTVTIDSILFTGVGNSTIYLDLVAQNRSGSLVPPPGDFNGDYAVNAADLTKFKTSFGPGMTGADFLSWQRGLGTVAAVAATAPVPEPAAAMLTLSVIAACCISRRAGR